MDTGRVRIVTDSTALLSAEEVSRYGISVIPLRVIFGTEIYNEGVDITNEEYYRRLLKRGKPPTTSQPPVGDFIRLYRRLAEAGYPVLSLHISSQLSGTVHSARAAKSELPGAQIEIVDCLTVALRMLIAPAARAAEEGQSLSQIKTSIEKLNSCMNAFGILDTLEYLSRGGRIGAAKALLGTMLRIKPILAFEGGELRVLSRARTRIKAMEYIIELMRERTKDGYPVHVGVVHTQNIESAGLLKSRVEGSFDCAELETIELGPVLASHLGPGFFGIGFYSDGEWQPD
jgi:DegV family protein with EDD domain